MEEKKEKNDAIDLNIIYRTLLSKKKSFFKVWAIVFVLSCLWILPEPRYYSCEVTLAPETGGDVAGGSLASIASNFGFNLGGNGNDAIYPTLYPDLMESNEFIVGLMNIQVQTEEKDVNTDYYTYLCKHQKKNWLTSPVTDAIKKIKGLFVEKKKGASDSAKDLNPFLLSEFDFTLMEKVKSKISCSVDKKTDVITISVKDQDRIICATMADSVRQHLQDYITEYRTKKARLDAAHYCELAANAKVEYEHALSKYSEYCDANRDVILQAYISERDKLENEMQMTYNAYNAMMTQYMATKTKVQERTPAFSVLTCATVPIKPTGPKRMLFVACMLILSTLITTLYYYKKLGTQL